VDYSHSFVGSLVLIPKHIIAMASDSSGKQTALRVKENSIFLIIGIIDDEHEVPEMWKTMHLYKVFPITTESYDEFLFPVKQVPTCIFIEAEKIFLWSENT